MGLDAAVFWNERNLPAGLGPEMYTVEEGSGEYLTIEEFDHRMDEFRACDKRLCNMGGAGELRKALLALGVGEGSVLQDKVVYSGTHCGDWLALDDVEELAGELKLLGERDGFLGEFLTDMRELVAVSRREQRPIVFV